MNQDTPNSKDGFAVNNFASEEIDAVNEEYVMPCAEAMLAGTLALMTGHSRCGCPRHRDMMGSKAAANLALLAQHPVMSEQFRAVASKLHTQWIELVQAERIQHFQRTSPSIHSAADTAPAISFPAAAPQTAAQSCALWHNAPMVIQ